MGDYPHPRAERILARLAEIRDQLDAQQSLMAERNALLAEGQSLRPKLTQKEMARVLGISDATVNIVLKTASERAGVSG